MDDQTPAAADPDAGAARSRFDELCAYHQDLATCREYCSAFFEYEKWREAKTELTRLAPLRRAAVDAIIVSYGRAFTRSDRLDESVRPSVLKNGFAFSKPEWIEAHTYWMRLRNKAAAHTDEYYRQVRGELSGRPPSYRSADVTLDTSLVRVIDAMAADIMEQLVVAIDEERSTLTDEAPNMPRVNGTRYSIFDDPEWAATVPIDDDE